MKVFLLAIAIVDDLGAVLVIAIFYTSHINATDGKVRLSSEAPGGAKQ